MEEVWKDIPGYEGRYQVSDQGNVRSNTLVREVRTRWGGTTNRTTPARVMRPYINNMRGGYRYVNLHDSDGQHMRRVARLVLEAFCGPCPKGLEACHNDGDPAKDVLSNLRWDTRVSNVDDKRKHGTMPYGELHHGHKLTGKDVEYIRASRKSRYELADMFNVHHGHIYNIRKGFKRAVA